MGVGPSTQRRGHLTLRTPFSRLKHVTLCVALSCSSVAVCAEAEEIVDEGLDAGEEGRAAVLFREGRALLVAGRFAEACDKLEESQRLEPRLGTQLNLAFCQERLGKVAAAWFEFQKARDWAQSEGDVARSEFAANWIAVLEPRLSWLDVQVAPAIDVADVAIYVDGEPLASGRWSTRQLMDAGEHLLVAIHDGAEYWRSRVVLRESQHVVVAVPEPTAAVAAEATPQSQPSVQSTDAMTATTRPAAVGSAAKHFVFQVGVVAGFMGIDTVESEPDREPNDIEFYEVDEEGETNRVSCGNSICSYGSPDGGWAVLGVTGFVGYTFTDWSSVGVRSYIGANLGGGTLLTVGPSVSFRLRSRFDVGPTLLVGAASHAGAADTQLASPSGNSFNYYGRVHATTQLAVGLGVDVGMDLVRDSTGAFVLRTAPLFLSGANGFAWFVPLGLGYRWY